MPTQHSSLSFFLSDTDFLPDRVYYECGVPNHIPFSSTKEASMGLADDFKAFILRGNVVDLAVGVVIGAAFGSVVTAFTKDFITPLIGIPGKLSVGDLSFTVNGSRFLIGDFLN